tara:strand:- start:672 stop:1199 length:528 start_codon:yes stop_codon:yes gene_type:complete
MKYTILILIILVLLKIRFVKYKVYMHNYYINKDKYTLQKIETLKTLNLNIEKLISELKVSEYSNQENVKKLFTNWSGFIEELDVNNKNVFAYNVNKGESISICLVNSKTNQINGMNELIYVTLHELAHVMTDNYEHNKEFWENFNFLIKFAKSKNIYNEVNYDKNKVSFCNDYLT